MESHRALAFLADVPCKERALTQAAYDLIVLSPHLDDAVLSCGGLICLERAHRAGILVVTCFTADPQAPLSPLAQQLHSLWGGQGAGAYAMRREEDRRAMRFLGADYLWLDCPEIVYREHGAVRLQDITDPASDPDRDPLFADLCAHLAALGRAFAPARVIAPLAAGDHRDHRVVAAAARRAITPQRLYSYEDFPYAAWHPDQVARLTYEQGLVADALDITAVIARRLRAAELYASQIALLFQTVHEMQRLLLTAAVVSGQQRRFVERYWRCRDQPPILE